MQQAWLRSSRTIAAGPTAVPATASLRLLRGVSTAGANPTQTAAALWVVTVLYSIAAAIVQAALAAAASRILVAVRLLVGLLRAVVVIVTVVVASAQLFLLIQSCRDQPGGTTVQLLHRGRGLTA